ncbi:MBL fold metallo-hydrolase [Clostridiaceae bacterium 35-E11]
MQITFLGAANTVTGSNYLITTDKYKILLDCGQFQGGSEIEKLNFKPFAFSPSEIDFLILSHAHIDHSGRIPKLVKEGFQGKIFCTRATSDLVEILLKDSGHIHEMEALWENRKRKRAGLEPIEPLYSVHDAENSLQYLNPVLYDQMIPIHEDIHLRFRDAGHILGSSIVELWIKEDGQESKIVFSGDLGMKNRPLLRDPVYIEEADYLIIESTYGNRSHEAMDIRIHRLMDIIRKTIDRGGTVVIPSFAVGRTQELIYEFNKVYTNQEAFKDFLKVPVYIDSPMAVAATEIFRKNADCFDEETREYILKGDNPLDFYNLHLTRSAQASRALNTSLEPKIIISASGMCDAGRIKHHLKHHLWKKNSSIVFVGYQAEGTLGRAIKDGAKIVTIFGEKVMIRAQVHTVEGFSGHADQESLLDWLKGFKKKPKKIFVVHGEKEATKDFAHLIEEKLHIQTFVPDLYDCIDLSNEQAITLLNKNIVEEKDTHLFLDIEHLSRTFIQSMELGKRIAQSNLSMEDRNKIKNKIIQLEKELIDFDMLLGDKKN